MSKFTSPIHKSGVAAIIPIIPDHLSFLPRLLKNLHCSSLPFDEVIVVASGFDFIKSRKLETIATKSKNHKLKIVNTVLAPAGTNRNLGALEATSRFIAFLDADDLYRKDRLEILLEILKSENATAVVHDYVRFRLPIVGYVALFLASVADRLFIKKRLTSVLSITERSALSTNIVDSGRLHHAHVLVDKEMLGAIAFSDTTDRNEDAIFLRAIQDCGGQVFACRSKLSAYFLGSRIRKLLALLKP